MGGGKKCARRRAPVMQAYNQPSSASAYAAASRSRDIRAFAALGEGNVSQGMPVDPSSSF